MVGPEYFSVHILYQDKGFKTHSEQAVSPTGWSSGECGKLWDASHCGLTGMNSQTWDLYVASPYKYYIPNVTN